MVQPLYTGGKLEGYKFQARKEVNLSLSEYEQTKKDLIFNIKKMYYNILKLERIIDVSKKAKDFAEKNLELTKIKFNEGKTIEFEVMQKEINLKQAEENLAVAENNLRVAKNGLISLIGVKFDGDFQLQDNFSYEIDNSILETLIAFAENNREEIIQMKIKKEEILISYQIAKSEKRPNLALHLNYYRMGDKFPPKQDSWSFGLYGKKNLFSGIARARILQAEKNIKLVENMQNEIRNRIRQEVEQCFFNLKSAKRKIEYYDLLLKQAKEGLRLKNVQRSLDLIQDLEVKQAELQFQQAELNYISAIYDYKIAQAELEKILGK